jgi:hypothetical protein
MFSTAHFVRAIRKETAICIRLFGKIPAGGLDYRPTAGQRSTLELLRYLQYGPYNGVRRIVAGDWSLGKPTGEVTKDVPASDFPRAMEWQRDGIIRLVTSANPVDLAETDFTFPWGETMKKGEAIIAHPFNWLHGYRMQLFLYLKAAGVKELNSTDLWQYREE